MTLSPCCSSTNCISASAAFITALVLPFSALLTMAEHVRSDILQRQGHHHQARL